MTEALLEGTITAPDNGVVFAYNPCIITFTGITSVDRIRLDFQDNAIGGSRKHYGSMWVNLHNGAAEVDVAAYLRAEFAGKAKSTEVFKTSCNMAMIVGDGVSSQYTEMEYTVIYGAMVPGETFNPSRKVKLWSAYPQLVSFFHNGIAEEGHDTIYVQKDHYTAAIWQNLSQEESFNPSISNYDNNSESRPIQERGQIIITQGSETTLTTFTMAFDGTFTGISEPTIINLEIDNRPQCDDHIFLRWLDKFGFWQYWLFKIGSTQVSDAVIGEAITMITGTTYPYYATRNIGKSLVKQVTACASNVDRETWDMLIGIKGSVNVRAFDTASQSWVPVNVAAETNAWRQGVQGNWLQDFVIKVIYPTTQTQRL